MDAFALGLLVGFAAGAIWLFLVLREAIRLRSMHTPVPRGRRHREDPPPGRSNVPPTALVPPDTEDWRS
jgi:hypothetical protein